jgi:acetylornithine deacetylase/succinyl-diaminopimelate desuccinylase-like protein
MSISVKDLLQNLLAVPSVNPVFGAAEPAWLGEARLTEFLRQWALEHGWKWLCQEVHPGRENLVVSIPGRERRPVTLWEVHQDTVGVLGMQVDPFAGVERDGRIYGRGACDVKGPMAAMMTAAASLQQSKEPHGALLLAFTVNEECGFSGAKALSRLWANDNTPELLSLEDEEKIRGTVSLAEIRGLRPQRAIVAEPTDFQVVVAHKGIVRWRCHTHGRAAHSSQPHLGKNAIYAMTDVISAIRDFDREVLAHRGLDCLCGRPSVSVNTMRGGTGANVVPDHAVIDIDRRLMPGILPIEAQQELIAFIAARVAADIAIEHEPPWNQSRGMQAGDNRAWAEQVADAVGGTSEIVGVPYGTDAWVFAAMGIPTVVLGPGSIAQAHTEDEWISVAELHRGVDVYRSLALI